MKCNKCKVEEAVISLAYLNNNRNNSLCLCESCSISMGIAFHLLLDSDKREDSIENDEFSVNYQLSCSKCGTNLVDFLASGQIGCSHCYQVFKGEIKSFFHLGNENYALSRKLKIAVEEENYEFAATLRDRIKILSTGEVNEFIEN